MERAPDSFCSTAASLFATLVIESAAKENTICVTSALTLNPHRFSHYNQRVATTWSAHCCCACCRCPMMCNRRDQTFHPAASSRHTADSFIWNDIPQSRSGPLLLNPTSSVSIQWVISIYVKHLAGELNKNCKNYIISTTSTFSIYIRAF
jgi:hypothetical protein